MISNTNKINPNEAIGRIGITPIAAKIEASAVCVEGLGGV